MPAVTPGKKAPNLALNATNEASMKLRDLRGKPVILYFYPKDNTSGCTAEAEDFRDHFTKFKRAGAIILGVSRDSLKSHEKFKEKLDLPFELVSDPEETLCQAFDVMKEKSMYGKKYMGIERSTFLIDAEGVLRQEWRKVKVSGHVEEVLAALKTL